jgi:hypothetical protein
MRRERGDWCNRPRRPSPRDGKMNILNEKNNNNHFLSWTNFKLFSLIKGYSKNVGFFFLNCLIPVRGGHVITCPCRQPSSPCHLHPAISTNLRRTPFIKCLRLLCHSQHETKLKIHVHHQMAVEFSVSVNFRS